MHSNTMTLVSMLAASAAAATVFVDNLCENSLFLQSGHGQTTDAVVELPANQINAFNTTIPGPHVASNAITVSRTPDLASPLQMVYNQGTNPVLTYYDLSTIYGDPLMAQGFQLLSGSNGFNVVCPPRESGDCPYTYSPSNPNGQNAVFNQDPNGNLILQFCSSTGSA